MKTNNTAYTWRGFFFLLPIWTE